MKHLFTSLGFTEKEIKVYLSLAEIGRCSAAMLAKRTGIARTTAYSVLESLVGKGLVRIEQAAGTMLYTADLPSSMLKLIEQERAELDRREENAKELTELLKPYFKAKNFSVPRLQFCDGRLNVDKLLEDYTQLWRESIRGEDNTWWGYQDHTFVEEYRPWLENTWETMQEDERIFLVSNRAPIEEELKGIVRGREIKVIPQNYDFTSTIWVLGQYIVMFSTRDKPHYAFQIHDPVFAGNLRLVFQLLWSSIK